MTEILNIPLSKWRADLTNPDENGRWWIRVGKFWYWVSLKPPGDYLTVHEVRKKWDGNLLRQGS